jgi:tRNA-uridine 2-sulfurtransferase
LKNESNVNSSENNAETPTLTARERVLVAMSGGVDSSVAALLLRDAGYNAAGATMKLFDNEVAGAGGACVVGESTCCSQSDVEDARQVAFGLGLEHFTFNFMDTFGTEVIDRFCDAYLHGRTPNPCIDCNRYLKFAALQRRRAQLGYDYVATGHYARRAYNEQTGRYELRRGLDTSKDQSYVLYHLTQDDLAHMLFPLGELTKPQVRELAAKHDFGNANKPESQDICFVPDGDYAGFIERYLGLRDGESGEAAGEDYGNRPKRSFGIEPEESFGTDFGNELEGAFGGESGEAFGIDFVGASESSHCGRQAAHAGEETLPANAASSVASTAGSPAAAFAPGPTIDTAGKTLGQHRGLIHYTIGQRKGIGVAAPEPLYVLAKDAATNSLIVGPKAELGVTEVRANDVNLISVATLSDPMRVTAKTHYRQTAQPATAVMEGDQLVVRFDAPVSRPAAGQALVIYDGDTVVAGGTIE